MWTVFDETTVLWIGIAICASAITYLSLSQRQKDVVIQRLSFRSRRSSNADTPPRSLSPDKKDSNNVPPKASEYMETFPPLQRDLLEKVIAALPGPQREAAGDLKFDEQRFSQSLLRFTEDYRQADLDTYSPTGISVREIRALGDSPDYSELTGVPLPSPYLEHDINKALPRPYRPFRWAYHQTMCKSILPSCFTHD